MAKEVLDAVTKMSIKETKEQTDLKKQHMEPLKRKSIIVRLKSMTVEEMINCRMMHKKGVKKVKI